SLLLHLGESVFRRILVLEVVNADFDPLLRELDGHPSSDATRPAGDESGFPLERHMQPPFEPPVKALVPYNRLASHRSWTSRQFGFVMLPRQPLEGLTGFRAHGGIGVSRGPLEVRGGGLRSGPDPAESARGVGAHGFV